MELIISSSDPNIHKRVGRGVCNFDTAVWDREKQNAVLSGNYAKVYAEPRHEKSVLSTVNNCFAEASPLDTVSGIGIRADDPHGKYYTGGEKQISR